MIFQKARKAGNSMVVTIPKEEVERLGIIEGEMLALHIQKAEIRPILSDELREVVEEVWEQYEDGLHYLAGR